jgi:phosphate transport system substrate-binding protein
MTGATILTASTQTQLTPHDLPASAGYILPTGDMAIIGNDGMQPLVRALCDAIEFARPDIRFHLTMLGSATAIPALAADACLIAPMSRAPWASEIAAFRNAKGYAPSVIHIGYTGHGPRPGAKTPPSIYVHKTNPIAGLPMADIGRIFSAGSPEGDINFWHQLGLHGEWSARRIHTYGLRDDGKYASGFRDTRLGGRPYGSHYEALADRASVIKAVALDPFSIGSIGWFDASSVSDDVRVLPLSRVRGGALHVPDIDSVTAGAYPLSAFLSLYFDLPPGTRMPALLREIVELSLADFGQSLVASFAQSKDGYLPLSPADLQTERDKLAAM